MAITSKQERMSVPGVGRPWMRSQYSIDTPTGGWRASVGNVYPLSAFETLDNNHSPRFLVNVGTMMNRN